MAVSQQQSEEKKARPVEIFKFPSSGGIIEVSVWENVQEGEDGERVNYSVTLQRSYFDKGSEEWKRSKSLFPADIPVAVHALQQAYATILNIQAKK